MIEVNKKIAEEHGLTSEEYNKICSLLKRNPNLTELGIFSAMWNEHCSYKSSRFHLKKLNTNIQLHFIGNIQSRKIKLNAS